MKKRVLHSVFSFLFALALVAGTAPAALAAVPKRPENKYVLDSANVLSSSTENRIISENKELFDDCGAEIVVAAVDFLGGESIEDYTYKMFNNWGVGSSERNNGILLVLAIGEEDYYVQAGYGIDDYFDGEMLSGLLSEYLEPDFAREDYDAGVKKIFGVLLDEMQAYYSEGPGTNHPTPKPEYSNDGWDEDRYFSGGGLFYGLRTIVYVIVRLVIIVLVVLVIIGFFSSWFGGRGGGPGSGGGGGGFWRGMLLGSMMNRRRSYWGVPPPPPGPRPGGFGGFGAPPPRGGGFGGFGGSHGGFHSGGGSRGGGAGRSGGGGGFHGGGGSHGGGAGRH